MKLLQGLPAYLPRMSPFEMLLILFFVAVFVTVVARPNSTDTSTAGPLCTIVFSKAGKTIEEKDVIACEFDKLHAWSDATRKLPNVVGHRAKRAIPELAQIRQIDLE